jgi:hypothetical protein
MAAVMKTKMGSKYSARVNIFDMCVLCIFIDIIEIHVCLLQMQVCPYVVQPVVHLYMKMNKDGQAQLKIFDFKNPADLISGFRRNVDEICAPPGYYTASCGNCLPTFRDNVSAPCSRVKSLGHGAYTLSRIVGKQLPHDAV